MDDGAVPVGPQTPQARRPRPYTKGTGRPLLVPNGCTKGRCALKGIFSCFCSFSCGAARRRGN